MAEPEPAASTGTDPFRETGAKVIIKNVDMTEEMQQATVDISIAALEKFSVEKDIASHIKREHDTKHGPTWHVVVGKNFGSYVTHGRSSFLKFIVLNQLF